jgi:hypothetical protein
MTTPNQTTLPPTQAVIVASKREIRVVEDDSPLAYIMDTAKFEHCYRIAEAMSRASLIPQHLKGGTKEETAANCFLVVNQALRWHMDPFLIAPETYAIQGKLGYQGKLVAAVINTRAGLAEKLRYDFSGEKGTDSFTVTVSGRFEGEAEPRTVSVSVGQAKTQNQMWTKDPEQKLVYTGSIRWARRHKPEIIMGVVTDEDLDAIKEQAMIDNMKMVKSPVFDGPPIPALPEPTTIVQPASATPLIEQQVERAKGRRRSTQTMVEEPLDQQKPVVETLPTAPQTTAVPPQPEKAPETASPTPPNETPGEKELRELNETLAKLCTEAGITQERLIEYMRESKWLKAHHKTPADLSSTMLKGFVKGWQGAPVEMVKRIKGA